MLGDRDMLPALYFIFSRMGCERAMNDVLTEGRTLLARDQQREVDVMIGEQSTVILPDGEIDIGMLAADEQVRIARKFIGAGVKIQVDKVKRAA